MSDTIRLMGGDYIEITAPAQFLIGEEVEVTCTIKQGDDSGTDEDYDGGTFLPTVDDLSYDITASTHTITDGTATFNVIVTPLSGGPVPTNEAVLLIMDLSDTETNIKADGSNRQYAPEGVTPITLVSGALVWTAFPGSIGRGVPSTYTVQLQDTLGAVITSFSGDIDITTFFADDPSDAFDYSGTVSMTNGEWTVADGVITGGSAPSADFRLEAASSAGNGWISNGQTTPIVLDAVATKLRLVSPAPTTRGTPFTVSIKAYDEATGADNTAYVPSTTIDLVLTTIFGDDVLPLTIDNTGWVNGHKDVSVTVDDGAGSGSFNLAATDTSAPTINGDIDLIVGPPAHSIAPSNPSLSAAGSAFDSSGDLDDTPEAEALFSANITAAMAGFQGSASTTTTLNGAWISIAENTSLFNSSVSVQNQVRQYDMTGWDAGITHAALNFTLQFSHWNSTEHFDPPYDGMMEGIELSFYIVNSGPGGLPATGLASINATKLRTFDRYEIQHLRENAGVTDLSDIPLTVVIDNTTINTMTGTDLWVVAVPNWSGSPMSLFTFRKGEVPVWRTYSGQIMLRPDSVDLWNT